MIRVTRRKKKFLCTSEHMTTKIRTQMFGTLISSHLANSGGFFFVGFFCRICRIFSEEEFGGAYQAIWQLYVSIPRYGRWLWYPPPCRGASLSLVGNLPVADEESCRVIA